MCVIGGSVWESNPPERLLTPHTGFEDQRAHQNSSTPMLCDCKPEFQLSQYFCCIDFYLALEDFGLKSQPNRLSLSKKITLKVEGLYDVPEG